VVTVFSGSFFFVYSGSMKCLILKRFDFRHELALTESRCGAIQASGKRTNAQPRKKKKEGEKQTAISKLEGKAADEISEKGKGEKHTRDSRAGVSKQIDAKLKLSTRTVESTRDDARTRRAVQITRGGPGRRAGHSGRQRAQAAQSHEHQRQ
jgi:hypothetical protein